MSAHKVPAPEGLTLLIMRALAAGIGGLMIGVFMIAFGAVLIGASILSARILFEFGAFLMGAR